MADAQVLSSTPTRQEVVRAHLERMLVQPDFPAFSENIHEVTRRAGDEEASFRQVTNAILKDLSLTLKVVRTANSSYYNRSGRTILTVTHAVALLGLDTIQALAGGMMLFQHYRSVSPGLKELMLLSLLSASHARVTATRIGYPRREEAYLCGMFRNLGEVLVACYLPRKYTAVLAGMKEGHRAERESCQRVLKCTFEDLGVAAARHWHIPEQVAGCIHAEYPRLTRPLKRDIELLEALTSFSHGLTEAIHRREPRGVRARLNYLLETHGPVLPVSLDDLHEIAEQAIGETKSTFDLLRIPLDDLRLHRQMETAMEAMAQVGRNEAGGDEARTAPNEELLASLAGEVETLVTGGSDFDLTKAILMILEALFRGLSFDRVLFALVSPDHTAVRGRLGLGHRIDELLEKFQLPLDDLTTPVARLLRHKRDFWTASADPEWDFGREIRPGCVGLYPVVVEELAVGCFYIENETPTPLGDSVERLLVKLKELAETAIARKRGSPGDQSSRMMILPTPSA